MFPKWFIYLLVPGVLITRVNSFMDPLSLGIAGVSLTSAAVTSLFAVLFNYERCSSGWMHPNITGLEGAFRRQLHGQHLVKDTVIKAIRSHVNSPNPNKALVLSFHGWTGGGKNFVSKIIAEHLYSNGMESKFVHLFVSTLHFPHASKVDLYKDQLTQWIRGNVSNCERSMFIFDEMDKMPSGLIDTIKPFIDYYPSINWVNYRKSIFIFLSNTAGNDITLKTLNHWESGKPREQITLKEMEQVIDISAFNENGGLWHSSLIEKNLISAFVPFLPLERQHVKLCVEDDLLAKGFTPQNDIVSKVADELLYFPSETKLFSKSGCKRVSQKVDLIVEDMGFD